MINARAVWWITAAALAVLALSLASFVIS